MSYIMNKLSKRKLFLFGRYSLALLLPKKWLTEMMIKAGDTVNVKFERDKRQVIIYFGKPKKKLAEESEKPKEPVSKDDLEPIPQL